MVLGISIGGVVLGHGGNDLLLSLEVGSSPEISEEGDCSGLEDDDGEDVGYNFRSIG